MSRSRNWCYTLNNYTPEEYDSLQSLSCTYHVLGKEVGEQGTPHIQGAIRFSTLKSLKQLKELIPRAHLEPSRDFDASVAYCKKDGDFEEIGLYKNGRPTKEETRKRLRHAPLEELVESGELSIFQVSLVKKARLILDQESEPYTHPGTRGIWIYGPPGTGKSHYARENYPGAFIKSQNKWFDGYTGQDAIILDDLDTAVLGHYLKIWADKYACSGEVKGGTVNLLHRTLIVTSNYSIQELFREDQVMADAIARRFELKHFLIKYNADK